MSRFSERCSRLENLNRQIVSLRLPRDLGLTSFKWDTLFRKEAIQSYTLHLPISCIAVSSALVETGLRWELCRRERGQQTISTDFRKLRHDFDLVVLFQRFIASDVPLEKLLDADEHVDRLRDDTQNVTNVKYIMTRNSFAHGEVLYPATDLSPGVPMGTSQFDRGDLFYPRTYLSHLLPFNAQELIAYGINDKEPLLETIAYVHLFKTLRFMQAFTELLIQKYNMRSR